MPKLLASTPAGLARLATNGQYEIPRHIGLLNRKLLEVAAGRVRRLIITLPPRHGKSELCSRYFPAWYLGTHPEHRFMLCGYGDEFAATWGRRSRDVLSEWGPRLYGVSVSAASSAADRWDLHKHRGGMLTAGVGGKTTGHGAHILVIDDPHKDRREADSQTQRDAVWQWYTDTIYPRLEPRGAIIIIMQRWHHDDLVGRLLKAAQSGGRADQWQVLNLPAIAEAGPDELGRLSGEALWPERFDLDGLERIRANMSPRGWISQYQQRPAPEAGATFRLPWLGYRYRALPQLAQRVMAVDSAFKTGVSNDFSCIETWGTDHINHYVLDVWRERVEYPDLKRAIIDQFNRYRPHVVLVEDAASGQSVIQDLQRTTSLPIVAVKPRGSKQSRADSVSPLWESGKVWLPEDAPWLHDFIEEHISFPFGAHDDMVDPGVYALQRMAARAEAGSMPSILDLEAGGDARNVWDPETAAVADFDIWE